MRSSQRSPSSRSTLLCSALCWLLSCVASEREPPRATSAAIGVSPAPSRSFRRFAHRPSPVAELLDELGHAGESVTTVLRRANGAQLSRYSQRLREINHSFDGEFELVGDRREAFAIQGRQRAAVEALASRSWGKLRVRWNDVRSAPGTIENIGFIRRGDTPQSVWDAFMVENQGVLRDLWGISSIAELHTTEVEPLGARYTVVRGPRTIDGLTVDGEFFEAFVTSEGSRFGAGILQRINASIHARRPVMPSLHRTRWLDATAARARVSHPQSGAMGSSLRLSCGARCTPYWHLTWNDGYAASVNALDGELISEGDSRQAIGPLLQGGYRPGDTTMQPIRFRGANVVTTGPNPVSIGETSPVDGTHSLTTSTPSQIGLEGPVGGSNPNAIGRIFRAEEFQPGILTYLPFYRPWTPWSAPNANFASPDAWAPNSDPNNSYVHTTALVYGWMSYYQNLFRSHIHRQIPDRTRITIDRYLSNSVNNCFCSAGTCMCGCGSNCNSMCYGPPPSPSCPDGWLPTGLISSTNNTTNVVPPDANGATTQQTITVGTSIADDIYSGLDLGRVGEERMTSAHEFGHGATQCAGEAGPGCFMQEASELTEGEREAIGLENWRPFVTWAVIEPIPNLISRVVNRFVYQTNRDGELFDNNFTYSTYDDPSDSFGTPTQDVNGTTNCVSVGACPSGYSCVRSVYHFESDNRPENQGGYCVLNCTPGGASCPAGLYCQNIESTNGNVWGCWPNGYHQQFLGTMGTRYVYTTDWRTGLGNVLTAVSGQAVNPTRDFVLGTDSFYQRMLFDPETRFEATRAVDSVYSGPGWTLGDDFPDWFASGTPLYVRSSALTHIWWGHGPADYPQFEDSDDFDVFIFRGLQNSSYRIQAELYGVSGSPVIEVWRLGNVFSPIATDWYNGDLTIGPLGATDWYAVLFWGGIGTVPWQGAINLESGDDISADPAEALPMVSGLAAESQASISDLDAFQIYARAGNSIEISVSGVANSIVFLYDPNGNLVTSGNVTPSTPFTYNNLTQNGHWVWKVWPLTTATISTTATLTCLPFGCPTSSPTRSVRYDWGDQFAGQFVSPTGAHDYQAYLTEGQGMSASVTDAAPGCQLMISVIPPIEHRNLRPDGVQTEMLSWGDGAVARELTGFTNGQGPGGYIRALSTGTYTFRVRPQAASSCPWYRIQLAHGTTLNGPTMPAW